MPKAIPLRAIAVVLLPVLAGSVQGQQRAALDFEPTVGAPAYPRGGGPIVLIDEGHHNFHTMGPTTDYDDADRQVTIPGRYGPFAELLRSDGYVVKSLRSPFSRAALVDVQVLVIANALAEANVDDWSLPNPSAFSDDEIEVIVTWVREGGALLLIADHQPWPAAAGRLAGRFGLLFYNGSTDLLQFNREIGSLQDHPITRGRGLAEQIDFLLTFGGQAFRFAGDITGDPLLIIPPNTTLVLHWDPDLDLTDKVPSIRADGMLQGAAVRFGAGRVAAFGEAAMFTAQVDEEGPMGMNHPEAPQNAQFVLNVLHWLTGVLPEQ
ncbi:conserved exported protein of unknown function [uncultured Woeseiaceae bacterium]|uniref:DUF4350 domain-containing protein n=1 Tax=uncultured Woeseiaceae bacterium TaxID=1983305 RepID=A0A7D9D3E8_9GAMM|nr:conserved exported protein of unknown function [uncultured Woeseiaceae bacterium]